VPSAAATLASIRNASGDPDGGSATVLSSKRCGVTDQPHPVDLDLKRDDNPPGLVRAQVVMRA